MMRRAIRISAWAIVGVLVFAMHGCETGPWPSSYLTDAVGHATAADVRGKLGPPSLTARALDDGAVWTYHYARGWPGSATYECYDYALTFDKKGIFRNWIQEECSENFPEISPPADQGKPRGDKS